MTAHGDIVTRAVRDADPDRYLATLYAPAGKRSALFALYAFNAEIAGVRDRIREALPGEVRLQWWREVVEGERPADGHPIAEPLLAAIAAHNLPRATFVNYLEARMFDLFDDPMPTRGDLEGYCGETASAIIQLAALVLDPDAAPAQADLAGHAGCAQAITGLLRLLPLHLARGQCYVPRDILAAAGTTPEEFLASPESPASRRALDAMIALANDHFAAFRKGAGVLPETLRPAFLPVAQVPHYLRKLAASGPTSPGTTGLAAWQRHWSLLRAAMRGW